MKFKSLNIIAIILIVFVIAIAGCASKSPLPSASTQANGSSSQQVGSNVSSSSVFGTNYNWIKYQMTNNYRGNEMKNNLRIERSTVDYKGTPAVHLKTNSTISTTSRGGNMVSDIYYDTSMDTILGGTITMTINGQNFTREIPESQFSRQMITNFNKESILTFKGTESVSVPAGTYPAASKYTKFENETSITYWVASGIPMPVKQITNSSQGWSTLELLGWG
jgi:hypothetical protein